jgi:hypothetical protein
VGRRSAPPSFAFGAHLLIPTSASVNQALRIPIHCIRCNTFASQASKRSGRPHQIKAREFLRKLQNNQIQSAVATQRVEELLLGLLKEETAPDDGPLSLELLNAAVMRANLPSERLVPRIFSLACQIMVRSGHPLALNELHRQVWRLLEGHKDFMTNDIPYNTHHVNDACAQFINMAVHKSYNKSRLDYETTKQVERLIRQMKSMYDDPSVPLVVSADACNAFIMYFCKLGKPEQAIEQLRWMLDDNTAHQVKLEPKLSSFSLSITAFANTGQPDKSMEIIQWMLSSFKSKDSLIPAPNRTCFNGLLHAWAKSGQKDAGEKAEQVLEWMQQLHETENLDTQPDEISFASCINAWAQSPGRDSPLRAESMLRRLMTMEKSGSGIKPTLSAFSSVMNAWARSDREDAPAKVEAILQIVEEISSTTKDFELTAFPYTILIKAWENAARRANSRKAECSDKALQILSRMQEMGITPPSAARNATIMALHEASAVNAVFYFLELEQQYRKGLVQLDTRTFNCGLNAIASMMKPDAAEKAMDVLLRMSGYSEEDSAVRPDETTFNVILKVLSRSKSKDAASRADKLLQDMISMPSVKPSYITYSTCIIAWGRSSEEEKFQRVQDLLLSFENSDKKSKLAGKLSNSVYNAALSVCYHNKSPALQKQALETALFTMGKLRNVSKVKPDKTTYQSLFRVLTMEPKGARRDELLETEFLRCIDDGLVTAEVLKIVQDASPAILEKFVGDNKTAQTDTIPKTWSSRVDARRRN